jgi:hypothetical protein
MVMNNDFFKGCFSYPFIEGGLHRQSYYTREGCARHGPCSEEVPALQARAKVQGLSAEQYALRVLEIHLAPEWLRKSWESAKAAGLDNLSSEEIDAEISAARKSRLRDQ